MKTVYYADDDILVLHMADKTIAREVSQDWYTNISYAEEIRRVSRLRKVCKRIAPADAGSLINHLRNRSQRVTPTPGIDASPDPGGNFLLGMAQAGAADYLVSSDKRHVLILGRWHQTHIITARAMVDILKL